jgi:hypothetical protein
MMTAGRQWRQGQQICIFIFQKEVFAGQSHTFFASLPKVKVGKLPPLMPLQC